ncbi:MAG TPA: hypothetical protein VGA07_07855 [Anaerolineales bacterium]
MFLTPQPAAISVILRNPVRAAASFPWDLAVGFLVMAALLVLWSSLIWRRHRTRSPEPARLIPILLNAAACIPAMTAWLSWGLSRIAPLTLADRWLVALALAWVLAPFAALALSAAGEALTRQDLLRRR